METFKERLEKIMEVKELNPNKLATLLGTSAVNIYRYMNGGAEQPSVGMLNKFEKIGINKNWLLDGKGEMFLNAESKNSTSGVPELWQDLKEQYEKRIKELEIFKFLYCQEKGIPNFLDPNIGKPKMYILENCIEALIRA